MTNKETRVGERMTAAPPRTWPQVIWSAIWLQMLFTVTAGVVVMSAAGCDPLLIAIASFAAFFAALLAGSFWIAGLNGETQGYRGRRGLLVTVCLLLIMSVPFTQWPLRLAFGLGGPHLDRLGEQLERSGATIGPRRVGPFRIKRAERTPAGSIILWLGSDTLFVRFSPTVRDKNFEVRDAWNSSAVLGAWEFGSRD
jgi:hypothetical protein